MVHEVRRRCYRPQPIGEVEGLLYFDRYDVGEERYGVVELIEGGTAREGAGKPLLNLLIDLVERRRLLLDVGRE